MSDDKPEVIAICGPDGAGKTTQATSVCDEFNQRGKDCVVVNPTYVLIDFLPVPDSLKTLLSPRAGQKRSTTRGFSMSIVAKIIDLLKILLGFPYAYASLLLVHKSNHDIVVCDRYLLQFLYDIYGDRSEYFVEKLPRPNNCIILSVDIETALDRMEEDDLELPRQYYVEVIKLFRDLNSLNWVIKVNANGDEMETKDEILLKIDELNNV